MPVSILLEPFLYEANPHFPENTPHLTKPVAGIASQSGRPFAAEPTAPEGPFLGVPWRTLRARAPTQCALWPLKYLFLDPLRSMYVLLSIDL